MTKTLRFTLLLVAVVGLIAGAVQAQKKSEATMKCRGDDGDDRYARHCEIKEQTLPASGAISVDGRTNGGIAIKGWNRHEILVRAKIETRALTQAEADQLAQQVRIETAALNIHAEGPESRDNYQWYVSYEIFVPRRSDLSLKAHNGGISIVDVNGRIDFGTTNGGVSLSRVGGAVTGNTTNGGVHVELSGARWEGEGLDVKTTNGGVNLSLPDGYSSHLETGTVNGRISFGFPVNVPTTERGRYPREISVDLGSGGPTIRVMTTNGGVRVGRASITE
jgi:DUF4097 and DUF4098 domain-containing protein YvlB